MTWGELSPFIFAMGCIALYGWGGRWKDRAYRLERERNAWRAATLTMAKEKTPEAAAVELTMPDGEVLK